MTRQFLLSAGLATALLAGTTAFAFAQDAEDHDAHHPEASETAPTPEKDRRAGQSESMAPGAMGRGMMGPGLMGGQMMGGQMMGGQMMGGQMMRGMMGDGPVEAPDAMMRRGTMGMMAMCPMMTAMMGHQTMDERLIYGIPGGAPEETTVQSARAWLEDLLKMHGNPRLRIGSVERQEDGTVIANIETVDGSLVQRLAFNRYPGFVRQVEK